MKTHTKARFVKIQNGGSINEKALNLNVQARIDNHLAMFPNAAAVVVNDKMYLTWIMGNNYRSNSKYYGEYPNSLLKRIKSLFSDCENILHLFSGKVPEDLTFDTKKELNPSICDDIRNIKDHKDVVGKMDLVIADPPYDKSDFEKYDCKPFDKNQAIRNLGEIMKKGSFLAWLDTWVPMYSKKTWRLLGYAQVIVSTNHRYRGLSMYQHI